MLMLTCLCTLFSMFLVVFVCTLFLVIQSSPPLLELLLESVVEVGMSLRDLVWGRAEPPR